VGQPLLAVQRKLRMEKADSQEWLSYKKIEGGDVPPPLEVGRLISPDGLVRT